MKFRLLIGPHTFWMLECDTFHQQEKLPNYFCTLFQSKIIKWQCFRGYMWYFQKFWVILIVDRRFQKNLKKCFWSKLWRILFGSGFRNLGFGGWNRHQLLEDYFTSQLCIDLLECICSVLGNFHLKTQYNLHSISNSKTCVTSISVITNTFILL